MNFGSQSELSVSQLSGAGPAVQQPGMLSMLTNLLGRSPEEREQNLRGLSVVMKGIADVTKGVSGTTFNERAKEAQIAQKQATDLSSISVPEDPVQAAYILRALGL